MSGRAAYRAGMLVAVATALLTVWSTIVRDDGNGIGFFAVILAALVGGAAARFRADGLARTMLGAALMQGIIGLLVATAPSTRHMPGGATPIWIASGGLAALWLLSAIFFRVAAAKGPNID